MITIKMMGREISDYADFLDYRRHEINNFPMEFAFNAEQRQGAIKELGPENDIVHVGVGCMIRKNDRDLFDSLMAKHEKLLVDLMADYDFALEAFTYELLNHEYGCTWDTSDALASLGLTSDDIKKNETLRRALKAAINGNEWEC